MTTSDQGTSRRVALLVESDCEDVQLVIVTAALQQAGAEVVVLGSRKHVQFAGSEGAVTVTSDATTTETLPDGFAAIIILGGMAPDIMRTNMKTVRFVQRAFQLAIPIVALGHGPQVLIEGELVQGKRVTGFRSIRKDLQHAGAQYADEPLVIDGPLMTARQPGDLPVVMTALLRRLSLTISGVTLPNESDQSVAWWQLGERWGGSSRDQIVEVLQHALEAETYALQLCQRHSQGASQEEMRALFQELCDTAQQHIQLLIARLTALGATTSPSSKDGRTDAQQDWSHTHDPLVVLLHVLDHLQARIVSTYRFRNNLTDPQSVAIFELMEVNLARNEQHLADLYHRLPSAK